MRKKALAWVLVLIMWLSACPAQAEQLLPPTQGEDIAALVEEAMGVYAWFTIWPLGGDSADSRTGFSGETLQRVLDARYDTRLELAEYALNYFSMELVTELLVEGPYEEIEGFLYVADRFELMDDNISSVSYELTGQGDGWAAYRAHVRYLQGTDLAYVQDYDYRYEWVNDRWVFTQFAFYWQTDTNESEGTGYATDGLPDANG